MSLSLYNALYRRLAADSTIAPLVGTRIWPGMSKDNAFPMLIIECDVENDPALQKRDWDHYQVSIAVITTDQGTRDTLAEAVDASLSRQAWTDSNVTVSSISSARESRTSASENGNPQMEYFRSDLEFEVIASV